MEKQKLRKTSERLLTLLRHTNSGRPAYHRRRQGFAISIILLAVALSAALGLALLLSNQTTFGPSNTTHDRMIANNILTQARNLKNGIDIMTARGVPIGSITLDASVNTGLFNPSTGGALPQQVLGDALDGGGSSPGWIYKIDSSGNPVVKIKGIGLDANPDYAIAFSHIGDDVCQAINDLVNGGNGANVAIPNAGSYWDLASAAIDLSGDNNVAGISEMCVTNQSGSHTYYMVVRPG